MEAATQVRRRLPIEQRRAQMLDAALTLIGRDGYAALSVEAVAREGGVSKTVVYDTYGGLAPLLLALLEREERSALRSVARAAPELPEGTDPTAAALAWVRALAEAVAGNPVTWRLMLIPPQETPAVVREHVQRGRDVVLGQAHALTAAIFAARPGVDVELAAHAIVAVAEDCAKLLLDRPGEFPPERLAGFAAATFTALS
jgi:AcrR family transcriptional regulator